MQEYNEGKAFICKECGAGIVRSGKSEAMYDYTYWITAI
jgi:hypothetical protein